MKKIVVIMVCISSVYAHAMSNKEKKQQSEYYYLLRSIHKTPACKQKQFYNKCCECNRCLLLRNMQHRLLENSFYIQKRDNKEKLRIMGHYVKWHR